MIDQKRMILLALMLAVASAQYIAYPIQLGYGRGFAEPHDTINQRHSAFHWANVRYLPKDAPVPFHHENWHNVYSHDHHDHSDCYHRPQYHVHNTCKPTSSSANGCLSLCPEGGTAVCGSDGVTYHNLCRMACYGASCVSTGACNNKNPTSCSQCVNNPMSPVCGSDNLNYYNSCYALCAGKTVAKTTCCDDSTTSCIAEAISRRNYK